MNTQYPRHYYTDLLLEQIVANGNDADELMVQRLYDVPGIAQLIRGFMLASGQPLKRDSFARGLAVAIELAVFAAIEKSAGEMAEIEAMQTPDPEDFDDQSDLEKEWNDQADAAGVRRV